MQHKFGASSFPHKQALSGTESGRSCNGGMLRWRAVREAMDVRSITSREGYCNSSSEGDGGAPRMGAATARDCSLRANQQRKQESRVAGSLPSRCSIRVPAGREGRGGVKSGEN